MVGVRDANGGIQQCYLHNVVTCVLVTVIFIVNVFGDRDLRVNGVLCIVLNLFITDVTCFVLVVHGRAGTQGRGLVRGFKVSLVPCIHCSRTDVVLLCFTTKLLPMTVLFGALLCVVNPLVLLSIVFFIRAFVTVNCCVAPGRIVPRRGSTRTGIARTRSVGSNGGARNAGVLATGEGVRVRLTLGG